MRYDLAQLNNVHPFPARLGHCVDSRTLDRSTLAVSRPADVLCPGAGRQKITDAIDGIPAEQTSSARPPH